MRGYLMDKEVAVVMGVSRSTLYRILRGEFGGAEEQPLLKVKRWRMGKRRRWDVGSICAVFGKEKHEIEAALA